MAKAVSFRTKDMKEGGGLPSGFIGEVADASFEKWNYGSTSYGEVLALKLTIAPDDEEVNDGKPVEAYYSAGKLSFFAPSEDGEEESDSGPFVVPTGTAKEMNLNTNLAMLVDALEKLGWDEDLNDARVLIGIKAQWDRVPQKERAGLPASATGENNTEQKRPKDILLPTVLVKQTKGAAAKKSTAAKTTAAKTNGAGAGDDELRAQVETVIATAVAENEGTLQKKALTAILLQSKDIDQKSKSKAVKLVGDNAFLSSASLFKYDADTATLSLSLGE